MKELEERYTEERIIRPSFVQRFFILCSGADKEILYQCPTELNKYAGIGATIFFTGLLASLSGSYALFTIFRGEENAIYYAIMFGILWGFVILNLDRFIVSNIRKEGKMGKEVLNASPRFILAIIISVVIAKPLEVRLFESRIEQQILEDKRAKLESEKLSIDKLNDLTKLENEIQNQSSELGTLDSLRQSDPANSDFKQLLNERNNALQDLNNKSKIYNDKIADYNNKISEVRNNPDNKKYKQDTLTGNPIFIGFTIQASKQIDDFSYSRNVMVNELKTSQKHLQDLDAEIQNKRNDYQALIAQRIAEKQADIQHSKANKSQSDSVAKGQFSESVKIKETSYTNNFITQLEAMSNLTSSNSTMWWTSGMIMLLFIVLETAPILVKLLSKRGPYDEILDRIEYEHYISQQEIISRWNSKINELLEKARVAAKLEGETFIQVEKQRLDHELNNNKRILEVIAIKQQDLAMIAIERWYQDELTNVDSKIEAFKKPIIEPKLQDIFWRKMGSIDKIEYYFRHDNLKDENVFLYFENEVISKGSWSVSIGGEEVFIDLASGNAHYFVSELGLTTLKLKEYNTGRLIEFEKA